MTSNDQRKASCKAVGGEKKRTGHLREQLFGSLFCDPDAPTTYKAEADKLITNPELLARLQAEIGPLRSGATSIKSGNNLQFTLGRIPELDTEDKCTALASRGIWEKYLGKAASATPADVLCYRQEASWVFFNMAEVISFITSNAVWRELGSGRLKGDFRDASRAGVSQYLTYEYRASHGSHFLGANGNKGRPFIALLMASLRYVTMEDTR